MKPDTKREVIRKLLHMAMGLFALVLHWLTPLEGALCAFIALAHNLWLFPRYGMKKLERPEEKARGYSGMIGYPAVVLLLCLLFPAVTPDLDPVRRTAGGATPHVLWAVAGAWAILAFGDAFAALCGLAFKGPSLPWNRGKRWTGLAGFIVFGSLFSTLFAHFVAFGDLRFSAPGFWHLGLTCLLATLVGAVVESLPGQIDDNLTVPLASGLVLVFFGGFPWMDFLHYDLESALRTFGGSLGASLIVLLVLNAALGAAAWRFRWVTGPSALLGILWGTLVAAGLGWEGYGFLLLFYLAANGSTYVGRDRKRARKIAEEDGGRRGMTSVFSKGLFPALFALVSPLAFVAALAAYAADTVASEIGKLSDAGSWLLWGRRKARAGEPGGVSFLGCLAGGATLLLFCGAFYLSFLVQENLAGKALTRFHVAFLRSDLGRLGVPTGSGVLGGWMPLVVLGLFLSVLACFFLESVLNETVVAKAWFPKIVVHLFIGALAGGLPFLLAAVVGAPHFLPPVWLMK